MEFPNVSLFAWLVYLEGLALKPAVYKKNACTERLGSAFQHLPRAFQHCASQHILKHEDLDVLEDGRCLNILKEVKPFGFASCFSAPCFSALAEALRS